MPHVLYVAYSFPPSRGISSIRASIFVKYLQELGWDVTVLTGNSTDSSDYMGANVVSVEGWGERLLNGVPRKLGINPRWLRAPDAQKFWAKKAFKVAKKTVEEKNIDVFYTTGSPFSSHLLGLRLKESTGLPWAAEFRDPWVRNYGVPYPTNWHRKREENMEAWVVENADVVVNVTWSLDKEMKSVYPHVPEDKFLVLPNGFDPDSFSGLKYTRGESFKIVYTGSLWKLDPTPVFEAIAYLNQRGSKPHFSLDFIGNSPEKWKSLVSEMGIDNIVSFKDPVPHNEVPGLICSADCLLQILYRGKGRERILGGKLGEYLASKRPIITVANQGELTEIMKKAAVGPVIEPEDVEGIAKALQDAALRWHKGELTISPNEELIKQFNHSEYIVPKLAHTLEDIVRRKEK